MIQHCIGFVYVGECENRQSLFIIITSWILYCCLYVKQRQRRQPFQQEKMLRALGKFSPFNFSATDLTRKSTMRKASAIAAGELMYVVVEAKANRGKIEIWLSTFLLFSLDRTLALFAACHVLRISTALLTWIFFFFYCHYFSLFLRLPLQSFTSDA